MRILFMGTPDFAAVSLKRLVEDRFRLWLVQKTMAHGTERPPCSNL